MVPHLAAVCFTKATDKVSMNLDTQHINHQQVNFLLVQKFTKVITGHNPYIMLMYYMKS